MFKILKVEVLRMPQYQITGTGKFSHIKGKSGETSAVTENRAFSNIARRNGIKDEYYYFKSTAKIEVVPDNRSGNYNPNLSQWIARQP